MGHCPKGSLCQEELKGANTCPANFPYFVLLRHKARERNEKVQAGETAQHGLAGEELQWELRSKKLKGTRQMMSGERQRGRATQGHTSVQLLWTKATVYMAGIFGWATTAKATY